MDQELAIDRLRREERQLQDHDVLLCERGVWVQGICSGLRNTQDAVFLVLEVGGEQRHLRIRPTDPIYNQGDLLRGNSYGDPYYILPTGKLSELPFDPYWWDDNSCSI